MRSCGASTHWGTSPVKIRIANSAGFCYGVRRAVELAEGAARSGEPCVMLGPIIHNQDMMDHLARHGLRAVVRPEEVPGERGHHPLPWGRAALSTRACMPGASASWTPPVPMLPVSIRSWPGLRSRGGSPSSSEPGTTRRCWPLRAGAAARWSCLERRSWKTGWRRTRPDAKCHSLLCPQTTAIRRVWDSCVKKAKKECTNAEFFDTICGATSKRQEEAVQLAAQCGAMVVIGDRQSSNTRKLAELCREVCPSVQLIERVDDLELSPLRGQRLSVSLRAHPRLRG